MVPWKKSLPSHLFENITIGEDYHWVMSIVFANFNTHKFKKHSFCYYAHLFWRHKTLWKWWEWVTEWVNHEALALTLLMWPWWIFDYKWKDVHNFFTFCQNSWFRIQLENVNRGWTKLWSRSAWLFARHSLLTTSCSPSPSRLVVIPSTLSWKSWSKALVAKRTSPPVSWEESWGEENKTDWWRDWTSVWKSSHGCEAQMWIMWKRFQFWRRTERTKTVMCDYANTFTSEEYMFMNTYHSMCNREDYVTPCPWKRCSSNREKQ